MPCIKAPIPSVPDLPTGISLQAPPPVIPDFNAELCCKLFNLTLPPLPPLAVAFPLAPLQAINAIKDEVMTVLTQLAFDCPRE